ncbi:hypothetical protein ACIGMX_44975 [Streptomyces aquilus]|nr:hypothetical protein [Streptomyces aquilus]
MRTIGRPACTRGRTTRARGRTTLARIAPLTGGARGKTIGTYDE